MKKRYVVLIAVIALFSVFLGACAASSNDVAKTNSYSDESSAPGRKVVYTYSGNIYTGDINTSCSKVTQIVNDFAALSSADDCYVKRSEKENGYAFYIIKITSENFNLFVAQLSSVGRIDYERTTSEDITSSSSSSQNTLSTINVHIYLEGSNKLTFNQKLQNAVSFVWMAIVGNFLWIILLILPFAVIIAAVTLFVYFLLKYLKKKQKKTENKKKEQ